MHKTLLIAAAISGFLAVTLGAFGAHSLKASLGANLAIYQTAVQYHFFHTFALLITALLSCHYPNGRSFIISSFTFLFGMVLFSGSLYLLAITNIRWLGAITPVGGVLFLIGWGTMAKGLYHHTKRL